MRARRREGEGRLLRLDIDTRLAYISGGVWSANDISLEIIEADHPVVLIRIRTPVGELEIVGNVTLEGAVLSITAAHVEGLRPGALGRAGLNAIGRKLLEETDAKELFVQGATRATGARRGRTPKPFRFPR
jgi:hypothetical protein